MKFRKKLQDNSAYRVIRIKGYGSLEEYHQEY